MLKPPALPPQTLLAGKIAVGISWLIGLAGLLFASAGTAFHTIGIGLLAFLVGSHALELVIYSAFLKAARASTSDYVQVSLFGIFHSGGMHITDTHH